ncbi:MAG: hypothetical protein GWO41_16010 [candidate division Zixibacteria bacterium]|nr:hypothetical protein [candidate division Zixibacteria bacterium]NIW42711.1 hypothetical protein [candidate division Zixibacteria bacterium]
MMWAERPVLVITGEDDRRIPLAYVENRVERMSKGGIIVSTAFFPDEDHYLVFSEPEDVTRVVAEWIRDQ